MCDCMLKIYNCTFDLLFDYFALANLAFVTSNYYKIKFTLIVNLFSLAFE
uniref:Uncharacterized protein n=1 Tax=Octopus bimaculoides TaxID=37653 RepID=A0A0L8G753_OCTBM